MSGYRHDYLKFYQLPNSNLFTHRMLFFSREATSEIYGPWVSSLLYLPSRSIFLCFYFQIYISKNPKITCSNLLLFTFSRIPTRSIYPIYYNFTYLFTREGLTTPLLHQVARAVSGAVLRGYPTGSITLVSSPREIPTVVVLHHPFLFGEIPT